jgi:hypothetical protein
MVANVSNIALSSRQQMEIDIAWQLPEEDWVVQNTDGARRRDVTVGCAGLLHNSNGHG